MADERFELAHETTVGGTDVLGYYDDDGETRVTVTAENGVAEVRADGRRPGDAAAFVRSSDHRVPGLDATLDVAESLRGSSLGVGGFAAGVDTDGVAGRVRFADGVLRGVAQVDPTGAVSGVKYRADVDPARVTAASGRATAPVDRTTLPDGGPAARPAALDALAALAPDDGGRYVAETTTYLVGDDDPGALVVGPALGSAGPPAGESAASLGHVADLTWAPLSGDQRPPAGAPTPDVVRPVAGLDRPAAALGEAVREAGGLVAGLDADRRDATVDGHGQRSQ